jgi:mono/diheme cytochrome c family protein
MGRLGYGAAVLVIVVTVLVAIGVGQKHPPHPLDVSAVAQRREQSAVRGADAEVKSGETLFGARGCSDCHTIAAGDYSGRLGPRLDAIAQGDSAKEILGNIASPPDDDPGYEPGLMPEDYGSRLTSHDLRALATYINAAASAAKGGEGSGG